jgi:hypothetical protein
MSVQAFFINAPSRGYRSHAPLTLASLTVLASAGLLASCATTATRAALARRRPTVALARRPRRRQAQSCLPTYRSQDMVVIDENTILFRDGATASGAPTCAGRAMGLGRPGTALLTKQFGGHRPVQRARSRRSSTPRGLHPRQLRHW